MPRSKLRAWPSGGMEVRAVSGAVTIGGTFPLGANAASARGFPNQSAPTAKKPPCGRGAGHRLHVRSPGPRRAACFRRGGRDRAMDRGATLGAGAGRWLDGAGGSARPGGSGWSPSSAGSASSCPRTGEGRRNGPSRREQGGGVRTARARDQDSSQVKKPETGGAARPRERRGHRRAPARAPDFEKQADDGPANIALSFRPTFSDRARRASISCHGNRAGAQRPSTYGRPHAAAVHAIAPSPPPGTRAACGGRSGGAGG